eukprot:TRINITY_DN1482_c0_g1_i3.p1 TRINITY_DN1482_c0_g1~~TRINITY_DN1482_c0_g1_i3.p1  ORF type:complete len:622 (-),score=158.33 TRINITY_DN1482_c0_g1_i3:200-2065(-)
MHPSDRPSSRTCAWARIDEAKVDCSCSFCACRCSACTSRDPAASPLAEPVTCCRTRRSCTGSVSLGPQLGLPDLGGRMDQRSRRKTLPAAPRELSPVVSAEADLQTSPLSPPRRGAALPPPPAQVYFVMVPEHGASVKGTGPAGATQSHREEEPMECQPQLLQQAERCCAGPLPPQRVRSKLRPSTLAPSTHRGQRGSSVSTSSSCAEEGNPRLPAASSGPLKTTSSSGDGVASSLRAHSLHRRRTRSPAPSLLEWQQRQLEEHQRQIDELKEELRKRQQEHLQRKQEIKPPQTVQLANETPVEVCPPEPQQLPTLLPLQSKLRAAARCSGAVFQSQGFRLPRQGEEEEDWSTDVPPSDAGQGTEKASSAEDPPLPRFCPAARASPSAGKVLLAARQEELPAPPPPLQVPSVCMQEAVRAVPKVEVREIIKKVPKIEYQVKERIVEVPEIRYVEKVVEVPEVYTHEVVRAVPKIEVREVVTKVPKIEVQVHEKIVEDLFAEEQEKTAERTAEAVKKDEEERIMVEERRLADEKRAEQEKQLAEKKAADERKKAERKEAEKQKKEEKKRLAEERRVAEERRLAEERRAEQEKKWQKKGGWLKKRWQNRRKERPRRKQRRREG